MTCAHVWPDELTPDAACLLDCGTTYGEWSEEREASSLITASLTYTPKIEVRS
jgi:hypothetical protein